ncbi:MAG: DUF6506 family protein [Clostridia bacterium]
MKFAFIIMGDFDMKKDRASIHSGEAQIIGVSSVEDACAAAKELSEAGIHCIELCGAFGEDGAEKIIAATGNKVPVGFVTHLPKQEALFEATFANQ